jgi:hypothetical protein
MPLEQKLELRDALGYSNWPTRFQTYEDLHVVLSEFTEQLDDVWSTAV